MKQIKIADNKNMDKSDYKTMDNKDASICDNKLAETSDPDKNDKYTKNCEN